tara:strand:- start:141 stop:551 length:411 start_codon:yes stop_codon:yes gene_type:complete
MQFLIKEQGQENEIECDSAGTIDYHQGDSADLRMREHASLRGYELNSIARKFIFEDFKNFDWIITMDENNFSQVSMRDHNNKFTHKIKRITDFCQVSRISSVPDPYYGGDQGFETVIDILEDACGGLLKYLKSNKQ